MRPLDEASPLHERYRLIGIVVWVSFVAACFATAIFFATFDPLDIINNATFPLNWNRTECYSAGFFLFWALTASTGSIVAWLVATPPASLETIRELKKRRDSL